MKWTLILAAATLVLALMSGATLAHPGSTDADGCHTNPDTGGYHCH